MIVFDLACGCGYTFEGWFQDRQDFDKQQTAAFLVCPVCGGREIRKILSPIRAQSFRNAGDELSHMKAAEAESPTCVADSLRVYLDGLLQIKDTDYSETTSTTFTMAAAPDSDEVLWVGYVKA